MQDTSQQRQGALRVLLVLPQAHAQRVFRHLLTNRSHDVESVSNAEDVSEVLQRGPYDMAVVDTVAGGQDPAAILRTLRGVVGTREALIQVLVTSDDPRELKKLINAGADDLLRMPAALDEIEYRLDAALRLARRLRTEPDPESSTETRPEDLLSLLPVPAFLLDERGDFVALNQQFAELVGYRVNELVGKSAEYVGLPSIEHFPHIGQDDNVPATPCTDRLSLVRSDMTAVAVDLVSQSVKLNGRLRIVGLALLFRERRTHDPLRTDARKSSDDLTRGLSMVLDVRGRIRTISPAFAAMFDQSEDALVGGDVRTLVHHDDVKQLAAALRSGTTSIPESGQRVARFKSAQDEWLPLAISGRDISDPHGSRGFLLVARQPAEPLKLSPVNEVDSAEPTSALPDAASRETVERLKRALDRGQIQVVYQPEVDLRSGRIVGVEVFARWSQSRKRDLTAAEFLDEFETSGLALDFDRQVIRLSGEHVASWLELPALERRFRIGITLSARTVIDGAAVDLARSEARRAQFPQSRMRVSLPISLLDGHRRELERAVGGLRRVGMQAALTVHDAAHFDYLGSEILSQLNVVKVPAALLADLNASARQSLRDNGVTLVATAIETPDDYRRTIEVGISRGQGYYFSHPVPAETFAFLAAAGPRPFAGLVAAGARHDDAQVSLTDSS